MVRTIDCIDSRKVISQRQLKLYCIDEHRTESYFASITPLIPKMSQCDVPNGRVCPNLNNAFNDCDRRRPSWSAYQRYRTGR